MNLYVCVWLLEWIASAGFMTGRKAEFVRDRRKQLEEVALASSVLPNEAYKSKPLWNRQLNSGEVPPPTYGDFGDPQLLPPGSTVDSAADFDQALDDGLQ